MATANWRIRSVMDDEGEVFYWANTDGWVDYHSATLFTDAERATMRPPQGAAAWTTV